jgi:LmbE family N-acetylglucosaminyl deacetylase
MRHILLSCFFAALLVTSAFSQDDGKLRIIAIGAHPDDCDIKFGGTAAKFAKLGHHVKFLSVTNGDAGHQDMGGGELAIRRYKETQESARRLGIEEYEVLPNHDGELMPTLEIRKDIIRSIRRWNADIVIAPRPNDYHPDHR